MFVFERGQLFDPSIFLLLKGSTHVHRISVAQGGNC